MKSGVNLIKVVWDSSMSKTVGIMQEEIIDIRKSEEKIDGVVMSYMNLGHCIDVLEHQERLDSGTQMAKSTDLKLRAQIYSISKDTHLYGQEFRIAGDEMLATCRSSLLTHFIV